MGQANGNNLTITLTDVKDVVPETGMSGFAMADAANPHLTATRADVTAANPKYILTGGEWAGGETAKDPVVESRAKIAVVMSRLSSDLGAEEPGYWITANYVNALRANGVEPILVDYDENPEALAQNFDGVMIIGGNSELQEKWYATAEGHAGPKFEAQNALAAKRADFEEQTLKAFMGEKKPVLGICNGMQVMAGTYGAKLTGSIEDSVPGAIKHTGGELHDLQIQPNTKLAGLFGAEAHANGTTIQMNSFHSEAVLNVPEDGQVIINAKTSDGVIEGVELTGGHDFAIGIQGHPEHYSAGVRDGAAETIIAAFVDECEAMTADHGQIFNAPTFMRPASDPTKPDGMHPGGQ